MKAFEELFAIAQRLDAAASSPSFVSVEPALVRLDDVASMVSRAFSGSWLGYHARVYYKNLQPPPAGAHFSQEWGLQDMSFTSMGSRGEWQEVNIDVLVPHLREQAGSPNLDDVSAAAAHADSEFSDAKAEMKSVLMTAESNEADVYLSKLLVDLDAIEPLSPQQVIQHWMPKGQIMTRDMVAAGQGNQVPPHIIIKAEVASLRQSFAVCASAARIARQAASHLQRKDRQQSRDARVGTNVFIGHGRSSAWRELKDFVRDRLNLPYDEFNRVPVAGVTNQARLAEMLDAAAVALVIMTAEDETVEGAMQARLNVIHEVGLFQGRLGFTKAIVLLEEGCQEFSNIQGLGQVRFPAGNIAAAFEEVRRVLEREQLISG